jgi:hypothetical protein
MDGVSPDCLGFSLNDGICGWFLPERFDPLKEGNMTRSVDDGNGLDTTV